MRLATWVLAAALLVLAGLRGRATADDTNRAVIDRVDYEPAAIGGYRLRVYLSALSLDGQVLDLTDPKSIKLVAGASEVKAPYALGRFAAAEVGDAQLALVVVVQATTDYTDVVRTIADALDNELLGKLDEKRALVAILTAGEAAGAGKLAPLKTARGKVSSIAVDGGVEPALLETLERALSLLKKARSEPEGRPLRKAILVIGDGRDAAKDAGRVTRLGERAAREGVRIHALAYSATNARRSMLTLGELAKRSFGTFRLLYSARADSWTPAFGQVRDELADQYVLTYFVPTEPSLEGKRVKIATSGRATTTSNELKVGPAGCRGEPCAGYCAADRCMIPRAPEGRGVVGWLVLLVVIGVVGIAALAGVGYLMARRRPRIQLPPGVAPPVSSAPPGGKHKPAKVKRSSAPPAVAHAPAAAHAPPVAAPVAANPNGPRFYVMAGPRQGETLMLRHGFAVGNAPDNDLQIVDGYTSGHHAYIGMDAAGNCAVYDRGSTNGTFVNGVRITEKGLDHGVSVRIGSTELRFLAQ